MVTFATDQSKAKRLTRGLRRTDTDPASLTWQISAQQMSSWRREARAGFLAPNECRFEIRAELLGDVTGALNAPFARARPITC